MSGPWRNRLTDNAFDSSDDKRREVVNRPSAVLVDMDGTLCDVSTVVHLQAEPDGFTAFHHGCAQCPPHRAVVDWCVDHHRRGHELLVVTGRDAWARGLTEQWLSAHLPVPISGLHMRRNGDFRSNAEVKREIYGHLASAYDIGAAIDDEPQIVQLWHELGIPVTTVLDWGGRPALITLHDADGDVDGGIEDGAGVNSVPALDDSLTPG
jgi:hypothetical protein